MVTQMREDSFAQNFVIGNCAVIVASSMGLGHSNDSGPRILVIRIARKFLILKFNQRELESGTGFHCSTHA